MLFGEETDVLELIQPVEQSLELQSLTLCVLKLLSVPSAQLKEKVVELLIEPEKPTDDGAVGAVVSIMIAFCPATELAPPTVGRVRVALLPALSLMLPVPAASAEGLR